MKTNSSQSPIVADSRISPFQQLPSNPLRVAVVSETYPPDVNGVAFTLEKFSNGLHERGHNVKVFRAKPAGEIVCGEFVGPHQIILNSLPVPGYPALRMGWPSYLALRSQWISDKPDVIYIATEGPLGWAALLLARRMGIPVVSGYHTNFCEYLPAYGGRRVVKLAAKLQRWFHNACAFSIAPSRDTVAGLLGKGYQRVALVRRGVDSDRFTPAKRDVELRASWGAKPGDLVVLLVGRVAGEKNLPLALDAAARLLAAHPRMKMVVVGDGPKLNEYRLAYPFVHFAGEHRGEALAADYASGDLLLFPSLTETFGNVLLEAMASGLPTLSFDYAASREHVVDGENGFCVPHGNSAAFVERFAALLETSPFLLDSIGSAARLTAMGLTWDVIVDRFEGVLSDALKLGSQAREKLPRTLVPASTTQIM